MTQTQNTTSQPMYTLYRVTADSARSTSGNLPGHLASIERDRQTQALGPNAKGVWIEMRING